MRRHELEAAPEVLRVRQVGRVLQPLVAAQHPLTRRLVLLVEALRAHVKVAHVAPVRLLGLVAAEVAVVEQRVEVEQVPLELGDEEALLLVSALISRLASHASRLMKTLRPISVPCTVITGGRAGYVEACT